MYYRAVGWRPPRDAFKPRPYQQQCRSNIVECYKFNDSFDKVERCFDIVAGVDGALLVAEQLFVAERQRNEDGAEQYVAAIKMAIVIQVHDCFLQWPPTEKNSLLNNRLVRSTTS